MLIDDIKKRMLLAMKEGRTTEKEILRVAIGEVQMNEARGNAPSDDATVAIVRKLIKSDEETLTMATDSGQRTTLEAELVVLRSLLPASLSIEQIVEALAPVRDAIRAAGNDGQATGVAMKHLRTGTAIVTGKDVSEAVKRVRA